MAPLCSVFFTGSRWASALGLLPCVLAAGCFGPSARPLETLPDLVDRGSLAAAGQAPLKVHPWGLRFDLQTSFVEETDLIDPNAQQRAFQVTLRADNRTDLPTRIDWDGLRLVADDGRRFVLDGVLRWNPRNERYVKANGELAAGTQSLHVARFVVARHVKLIQLIQLTLHWRYQHDGRRHEVATRFRVR